MRVVLVEPQIPPNTGNVARLCAALRIPLHLVGPLGFEISDRQLKRAGLDYWPWVELHQHHSFSDYLRLVDPGRLFFFSTRADRSYLDAAYDPNSSLIFGSETRGLPDRIRERYGDRFFSIPIHNPHVRSLNLSSAVAVAVYEALRQIGHPVSKQSRA